MKAAHDDVEAERAELAAEIERARKLVRLHADQPHHAAAGGADALGHRRHIDDGVALIAGIHLDVDVGAEHAVVGTLPHQAIDAGERVRRQGRAQPLDDIAVPVVMRRLDQLDPKRALGQIIPPLRMEPDCSRGNCPRLCGFSRPFATITFLPRDSGEGGPPEGWWKGRGTQSERRQFKEISTPTLTALRRQRRGESCAPSTTVRSLRELQWSPSPAFAGAESVSGFRFIRISFTLHKKGRRSADRRNCHVPRRANRCCHLFALGAWARLRARTPTGAPPRHLWQRTNAAAQLQPALPGTRRHRVLPASGLSIQSSGLPRRTGRSAGRAYPPKPPECGVQIRPREPHSPRIQVCLENTSLRRARYCRGLSGTYRLTAPTY